MSDNKLLAENTIRRFMKLANVETMTDNFISEMYADKTPPATRGKRHDDKDKVEEEINEEEIDLEEEFDPLYEEEEEEEEMEMDPELGGEPEEDADLGGDLDADLDAETAAADMSLSEEEAQLLIDLGERLSAAMGAAGEPAADDMGDMGDVGAMDDMDDMDPDGSEDDELAPGGRGHMMEQDDEDD